MGRIMTDTIFSRFLGSVIMIMVLFHWGSIKKGLHKHKQFLLELCLVQISNFWECNMKTVIKLVNKLIHTRHFHKHFVLTFGYEVWDGFKRLLQQKSFVLQFCLDHQSNFGGCNMKIIITIVHKLMKTKYFSSNDFSSPFCICCGYSANHFKGLLHQK